MSRNGHFAVGATGLGAHFEGETKTYEGRTGDRSHLTARQHGTLPTHVVANLQGARGEKPGEHTTRSQERYETLRDDIAKNGIKNPIFITVDHGQEPVISEGNNRRDVALELGHARVPVEVRYFGNAHRAHL